MAKNPHAVALGRRGGKANKGKTSAAKKRSGAENMAKARAALAAKRKLRG